MTTASIRTSAAFAALVLAFIAFGTARAQSDPIENIQFPIAELGGCEDKQACKAYCDKPGNMEACIAFAEKNNLMPAREVEQARKFLAAGAKGPGGCTGRESCEAYCNDPANIDACVDFAEKNGLMSGEELAEAKKVQVAIRSGVKPPPCGGRDKCRDYCESPENMPACIEFAKAAGLMSEEDQKNADQMLRAIQSGAKPPPCRGREACEAYCADDAHIDECVEFGKAAGFMTAEEAEMATKTRGKGPGGCRGREACDAFCGQPDNEPFCIQFAKEHGLISADRLKDMEEGDQRFRASFGNVSPEVETCLKAKWGEERYQKLVSGQVRPNESVGEAMRSCFEGFEQKRTQEEQVQSGARERAFGGGVPEAVRECIGASGLERMQQGDARQDPELAQRIGECMNKNERSQIPEETHRRPPEGTYERPPEGAYPMPIPEGSYQRPPEGTYSMPSEGTYQMPPEGYQRPPEETYERPPQETYQMPPEGYTAPPEGTHQAPSGEPAPSETTAPPPTSAELLSAAAILFLKALGF